MHIKLQLGNGDVIELAPNDIDPGYLTISQATEIAGGYIFNPNVSLPAVPTGGLSGQYSIQNLSETTATWGNAFCRAIRGYGVNTAQMERWVCGGVDGTHGTGGAGGNYNIVGARCVIDGITFYGVGFDMPEGWGFLACLISEGAIGNAGFAGQGGEETPPNAGADAGAGYGTYDYISQYVKGSAVPLDPPLPVSTTGYGYHAYLLSSAAFSEFGRRLWGVGDANDGLAITSDLWQKWQNYRFSPMAGIISCIRLPAELTPTPTSTADAAIRIAGTVIPMFGQSIAGCKIINPAPTTHVVLDVQLPETYASWLDFEGVDITLVLPFVGRVPIDPSACVGGIGRVRVVYQCDAMTGNLAAMVYAWDRWSQNDSDYQLYTVATGNAAVQVPLVGHADGQVQMLGTLAADALAAGASAAVGNPVGVAGAALSATSALMMRREQTQIVGTYAGSVSYVNSTTAYMIITKPQPTSSPHYNHVHGRPCDYGAKIGEYSGFNQFYDVDVELLAECTPEDRNEINRLLQGGVIL